MRAKISTLYRNGKKLPQNKFGKTAEGSFSVMTTRNILTGSVDVEAMLLTDGGIRLLPDLHEARCLLVGANGLMFRGWEDWNGREVMQEWWVRIIPEKG